MDYKSLNASKSTETQDINILDQNTDNIYKSVAVIARRAEQINDKIREELHGKLEEFASNTESLEEIFENKEQIEISKFYESLPKPTAMAAEEWKQDGVYFREPEQPEE